jgi:RING-finger-containing E3 ubiquitin ligase
MDIIKQIKRVFGCNKRYEKGLIKRAKVDMSCPICRVKIDAARITICGHAFCDECIDNSLEFSQKCPICRKDLAGTLLYPSKKLGRKLSEIKRVKNGVSCVNIGCKI